MILFLFFCSGATALVYEVVWSKYLSLMLGSTVQAQTVVLAVFMGGLALGNRLIGARSDLLKKPLAVYGYLEVLIGLYAFFFHDIFGLADRVFVGAGSRLFEHAFGMLVLKSALSVGLLLWPTLLMGGTLPLLSAWLQKQSDDAGRWSARFYSTNSLGAVCGSFMAGFLLIRSLGLVSTLQATALVNVIVGITAVGLGRRFAERAGPDRAADAAVPASGAESPASPMRLLSLLVALTGAVSMGLEVLASRSLVLIFGASLQAFAVVLMAFILGIGVGSAAVASPRLKRWRGEGPIIALLLAAAAIVGLFVLGIEECVEIYRRVKVGLAPTTMGYRYYQAITGGFSLVILGVPAALIGAVLPLSLRRVSDDAKNFGDRVGRLLTWNTLGAVVGVLFTGFFLMPTAGLRNAFNILALALCVPALLFAWRARRWVWLVPGATLVAALIVSSVAGGEGWRQVLSSAVFRNRETVVDPTALERRKQHIKILFYEDGPDATVTVEEGDEVYLNGDRGLRINGKPEASAKGDLTTQLLLAHLPMLARPGSQDVFVLGLASGISCRGFLAYPIRQLTVAENCRPVARAVDYFAQWNRGVHTNPVTRVRIEDARTVLKLEPRTYDVIMSEPSNPWFASVGSVFSREFYELAAKRLKPGGLMVQWFHVYEMHDSIVDMVLRTFGSVFPAMEIWDTNEGDMVLLGSDRPWEMSLESLRTTYKNDTVRSDLESIGLKSPEMLLARLFASQRTASAIAGPGPIQTDGFPVLEYEAPIAFFIGAKATRILLFDERTWQSGFMAEERRRALAGLDGQALRSVFDHETINRDLWLAVAERLKRSRIPLGKGSLQKPPMPCVFNPTTGAMDSFVPAGASASLTALIEARVELQNGVGDLEKNVATIRNTLAAQLAAAGSKTPERGSANFAAVAARACLIGGKHQLAGDLIALGLKFDADDRELGYLSRLLERESDAAKKPAGS